MVALGYQGLPNNRVTTTTTTAPNVLTPYQANRLAIQSATEKFNTTKPILDEASTGLANAFAAAQRGLLSPDGVKAVFESAQDSITAAGLPASAMTGILARAGTQVPKLMNEQNTKELTSLPEYER